jgi:hypothetical protein
VIEEQILSPADEAILKYLRDEVDRKAERQYRRDAGPNARQDYWHAAEDLKKFVSKLRQEGKNI